MSNDIQVGNATTENENRGWLVGHFMPKDDLRHTADVEIKWGIHKAGEARDEWVTSEMRQTVCILIEGSFTLIFRDKEFTLDKQGDYVMWGRGVDHKWRVNKDTVAMTVRWPSEVVG